MRIYLYLLSILIHFLLAYSKEENKSNEANERNYSFGERQQRNRYNYNYGYRIGKIGKFNSYRHFEYGYGRRTFSNDNNQNRKIALRKNKVKKIKQPKTIVTQKPEVSRNEPLFSPNCGKAKEYQTSRIVGGRLADDNEFPWQVSIQVNHLPTLHGEFTQYCGGAVLNERWVVTAAHCMTGVTVASMKGIVGANDISEPEPGSSVIFFDKAIVHEKYNETILKHRYDNDIALLHTKTKMAFKSDQKINSICLPEKNETFSKKTLPSVAGWGRTAERGSKSEKLRTVDVSLLEDENCKAINTYNPKLMICAGVLKGGQDSCQADSGGPLIIEKESKWYLIGIVSSGIGCGRKGTGAAYTKVTNYVDWIVKTISENST